VDLLSPASPRPTAKKPTNRKITARRAQKEAENRQKWLLRLAPAFASGLLNGQERLGRIAEALHPYMKTKDLTPELIAIADDYLDHVGYLDLIVTGSDQWLVDAAKHLRDYKSEGWSRVNIDHLRVGALNHLQRNWKG
jgi:hypothetical protein